MNKTINIDVPEGFEIDTEKSNLAEGKIVFKKKKATPWRKCTHALTGCFVSPNSYIITIDERDKCFSDDRQNQNVFATEKQAKSMLAMAQLSQIIENDERFGGPITDEEWDDWNMPKFVIVRSSNEIRDDYFMKHYHFLAFHIQEQRDLFLEENEDLIRQYFMLD